MSPENQYQLEQRIQSLLDGELLAHEVAQLDAQLRSCSRSREIYRQLAALHSSLEIHFTSSNEIEPRKIIPIERFLSRQRAKFIRIAAFSAAAVLALTAIPLWLVIAKNPETLATFQTTPNAVFHIGHTNETSSTRGHVLLPGSTLKLESGRIEALFSSGARCVLQAPAEVISLKDNHIKLKTGIAWFHVPPKASGFRVDTDCLEIVDLGTEFGVIAATNGEHEIHVTKGSVEASSIHFGKKSATQILKAGQACLVGSNGKLKNTSIRSGLFSTRLVDPLAIRNPNFDDIENLSPANDKNGYGRIPDWASSSLGVGLSDRTQPFLKQAPHSGTHIAFIQGNGLISQSINGFDPLKKYTVTYFINERGLPNASTSTSVSLDLGSSSYLLPHPVLRTNRFRRVVSGPLSVFGPTANIEIRSKKLSGDASLLIDSVSISRAVPAIPEAGFENPVGSIGESNQNALKSTPWIFENKAGIINTTEGTQTPIAPEGSQSAFLHGIDSSIQTIVHGFEPGVTYRLKLSATSGKLQNIPFQISLGTTTLSMSPVASDNNQQTAFKTFTSGNFSTKEENLLLLIRSNISERIYLDDLHFEFVAEANEP